MTKTQPNIALFTGNPESDPPYLVLMDKRWPIPKFAPKQNEVIVPIIMSLTPKLVAAMNQVEKDDHGQVVMIPAVDKDGQEVMVDGKPMMVPKKRPAIDAMSEVLTEDNVKRLYTCLYFALTRAHPTLTRKEFDEEFTVGTMELLDCVMTIADQTGVVKFKRSTPTDAAAAMLMGNKKSGEGEGANSQTGAA